MEMSCLRTSLIPGGLDTIRKNINAGEKNLKIFEIGKVFRQKSKNIASFDDFTEEQKLLVLLTGKAMEKQWYGHERDFDFFDLKGVINFIVNKKSLANSLSDSYYKGGNYLFDYYTAVNYNNSSLVEGGKIKKEILKQFDIKQDVFCFELNIDEFKKIDTYQVKFKELLRFPKIHRDFAFVFDKAVTFEEVKSFIRKKASSLLKNVTVFDIFESESLGLNKKSLAFGLEYFDYERTLTEEEVEKDFSNLIYEIQKEFNAILRGN
jgi:phenylalanyl-tRNA synthetase beta chain